MAEARPAVLVWSSLFPNPAQPQAGIFIRERMFRVGAHLPITVISPQPWFPSGAGKAAPGRTFARRCHGASSRWAWRLPAPLLQFSRRVQGTRRALDGARRAACSTALRRAGRVDLIDAHFGYPDGRAALRVARRLGVPCTVTLRGTEARHASDPQLRPQLSAALKLAARVFAVADSLRDVAISLGVQRDSVRTVGNGVDSTKFRVCERSVQRDQLGLPQDAAVLITVADWSSARVFTA